MIKYLFFVCFSLTFVSYKAQLCFTSNTFVVGSNPYCITKGDFNSDNFLDLVVTNTSSNNFTLLFNNGNGIFASSTNVHLSAAPEGVCSDDFNNDGNLDLAIACNSDSVKIFSGNGLGTFSSPVSFPTANGPRGILSSDVNNDGKKDLAIANYYANSISILLGNGDGSFNATNSFSLGLQPTYLAIGDFNNDGNKDLASANIGGGGISILLGNGTGNYPLANIMAYNGGSSSCIITNDLDNDGNLDLIVTNSNTPNTTVFMGDGTGSFYNYTNFSANHDPYFVTCGDFNDDSKPDLAVANLGLNKMSIVYGKGNGTFSAPISFSSGTYPTCITSGDFNNDGKMDVATSNMISGTAAVFLNNRPIINTSVSVTNICQGSSTEITASGITTYSWSNGATTNTIYVNPLTSQVFSVTGTDVNNCSTTQTVEIIVDNTCQDVWPGDANSDGIADNTDVLELGLHYTQTGPARTILNSSWQSFHANNWTGTISNGKNVNHSDCNGDGIINADDTLAIYNNYGLTHAFKQNNNQVVNPQLIIVPDQSAIVKGTWGSSSIYLGDVSNNITNLNGVAFTVDFDNTLIEPNSIWIDYINSFINTGDNLNFRKTDFANGKIYTATTHTLSNNVNGNGKIAVLHYQIKSNLANDAVLSLALQQANQSDASGNISPLTSGSATVMAVANSVGIKDITGNEVITVHPNPSSGILNIKSTTAIQKIELLTVTGQVVMSEPIINSNTHIVDMSRLSNGVYFLNLYRDNKIIARQRVVLNK